MWVKYTTQSPCIGLSESNSKIYTNFEFCAEKNHKDLKTHWFTKQAIFVDKLFFKKSLHILEDSVDNVQVDILNTQLLKLWLKHDKIT